MQVSATERGDFKRCPRKWGYSSANMESLGPIVPKKALSLGHTIHAALAQWLLEPDLNLQHLFLHAAAMELELIKEAYFHQVHAPISEDELGDYHDGVDLGAAMMANYQKKYRSPLFEGFSLIQAEVKIEVPIPHTVHTQATRLDGLIRRDRDGALFILEHKTYDSRPRMDVLQMNDQFLSYIWQAEQSGVGRIAGLAYDGMWKRKVPPRGSTFDDLFMRVIITRPRAEIEGFGPQLTTEADMMHLYATLAQHNPAQLYPNRAWNGCFDCGFEKLCALQSRGEDAEAYKQNNYIRLDRDKRAIVEGEE